MDNKRKWMIICIGWIVFSGTPSNSAQDPCLPGNYLELHDVVKRSPLYDQDATPLCDRYIVQDWYRAPRYSMSTSPPPIAKCGTLYPIWLRDPIPSDGKNSILTACEVGFSSSCVRTYDIDVKNCSSFLVYKLQPTAGCDSAYCFEQDSRCVNESVSDVRVAFHNVTWTEETNANGVTKYAPYVNFKCSFTPASDDSLLYHIDWYIDNDIMIEGQIVDGSSLQDAVLSAKDMARKGKKINSWIQCVVGIKEFKDTFPCISKRSNLLFAGIEVLNKTLDMNRNGDEDVLIRPTIPVVLQTIKTDQDVYHTGSLDVHLSFPGNTDQKCRVQGSALTACKITIPSFTYKERHLYDDPANWYKIYKLKIHNSDQMNYYMPSRNLVLRLQTNKGNGDVSQIYSDVVLHDVNINIVEKKVNWKGKRCSSYADPHQTTFDGCTYECQSTGCVTGKTYILYRNEKHLQEIQVRHENCWGDPRCICAVAVRAGQDVFTIDVCSGNQYINFPICNENALNVIKETDRVYKIILPTGTFAKVYLYSTSSSFWYINLEVYPTVSDVDNTKGLCGVLDNDIKNDLRRRDDGTIDNQNPPDQFSLSWQLSDDSTENLLSPSQAFNQLMPLASHFYKLCTCDEGKTYCSYRQYADCKTSTRGRKYDCVLHSSSRRKRYSDILTQHQGALKWRTTKHKYVRSETFNEVDAYSICNSAFQQSSYYVTCLQIVPTFSNESLVNCITDLVMTGDRNLTQLHLDTALGQCQGYIQLNSTIVNENPVVTTTIVNLCQNNCTNRGVCSLGRCSCDYGYGGSDCSFDVLSPPTVSRISGDGICDQSLESCDDTTLYGHYFLENMNTTCYVTRDEMNGNQDVVSKTSYTVPLKERTLFEGYCSLQYNLSASFYTTFNFFLSNDGTQSSTQYTVYTYQSTCQLFKNESGNIEITLKSGFCFMNGTCVGSGATMNNKPCWQCIPSLSTMDWSWGCNKTETSILPTTITPLSSSSTSGCVDKIPDCAGYTRSACNPPYVQWAYKNCPAYCGFCLHPCEDRTSDCLEYGKTACQHPYEKWAKENCAKYCGFCGHDTKCLYSDWMTLSVCAELYNGDQQTVRVRTVTRVSDVDKPLARTCGEPLIRYKSCKQHIMQQSDIDYIGEHLDVRVKVVDNLQFDGKKHKLSVVLINNGNNTIEYGNWEIYFYSFFMLEPDNMYPPTAEGYVLSTYFIKLMHIKGNLFQMTPTVGFPELSYNQSHYMEFYAGFWNVAKTDEMFNWYVSAPSLTAVNIASTAFEKNFVDGFTSPNQWKRTRFDHYNPFTPQERYRRYKIQDFKKAMKLVVPTPKFVKQKSSFFLDVQNSTIAYESQLTELAAYLAEKLNISAQLNNQETEHEQNIIKLNLNANISSDKEAYTLDTNASNTSITIIGQSPTAVYYGIQSLLSLVAGSPAKSSVPNVYIEDEPRYQFRGMCVDVARNFRPKSDIIRLMDAMAMYKMNKLHLRMGDDEGWRLEIPGIPELTQIGSKRCHDLTEKKCLLPQLGSGADSSTSGTGFFTRSDYMEIVEEARKRHIDIIPEIDMPGHIRAAIVAMEARYWNYEKYNYSAAIMYRLVDGNDRSEYLSNQLFNDNALNPCIESTYTFLRKVLTEIKEMHSGLKTFHFGGDEVAYGVWLNSTKCRSLDALNNFTGPYSVRIKKYFLQRIAKLCADLSLGLGGWEDGFTDENGYPIGRGTLPNPNIYTNAWQSIWEWGQAKRAYEFANNDYQVVLSPATHLYFDFPPEPDPEEPGLYWAARFIDAMKAFLFIPDKLYENIDNTRMGEPLTKTDVCGVQNTNCPALKKKRNIIGLQGHLWSETIWTSDIFDYKLFPRMLSVAERAWHKAPWEDLDARDRSNASVADWEEFANTIAYKELDRLEELGIKYRIPLPGAVINNGTLQLNTMFPGHTVQYSEDGGTSWFDITTGYQPSKTTFMLRTSSRDGMRYSRPVTFHTDEQYP